MAEFRVFLILFVASYVCIDCAVVSGKAYFCRDPDTGKLHGVNTTWISSSFCGNYTCKLRRRNIVPNQNNLIRQMTVNNINSNNENITVSFEKKNQSDIQPILHKNAVAQPKMDKNNNDVKKSAEVDTNWPVKGLFDENIPDERYKQSQRSKLINATEVKSKDTQTYFIDANANQPGIKHTDKTYVAHAPISKSAVQNPIDDADRYLTEEEIKNISAVLHTVKKSDLDAVVELYSLAQEIYKEVEKSIEDDSVNTIRDEVLKKPVLKAKSYWYDPLGIKGKIVDRYDLHPQATSIASTDRTKTASTFDNTGLARENFGMLPYYYPISSFQRLSSYTHQPVLSTPLDKRSEEVDTKPRKTKSNQNTHKDYEYERLIRPSQLLPYPFAYVHNYNISAHPNNLYYNKPTWNWNYYNRYRYYQPYYNAYIAQIPNAVLVNPNLVAEVHDAELRPVSKKDILHELSSGPHKKPDWKTAPIPHDVLEEIRAHVDPKSGSGHILRKLVNVEKVASLVKTNDVIRKRRSVSSGNPIDELSVDDKEYETFIERITCKTQVVPGFFRMGNMTQPFPGCCPELIKDR